MGSKRPSRVLMLVTILILELRLCPEVLDDPLLCFSKPRASQWQKLASVCSTEAPTPFLRPIWAKLYEFQIHL